MLVKYGFLVYGIQNPALGIRNLRGIQLLWNPESTKMESGILSTWDLESTAWNPESKIVTDYLTWGNTFAQGRLFVNISKIEGQNLKGTDANVYIIDITNVISMEFDEYL